jgi:hypothetical protein
VFTAKAVIRSLENNGSYPCNMVIGGLGVEQMLYRLALVKEDLDI